MKRWIGLWLMGVAVVHTVFAVVAFSDVLGSIIRRGVFNTVGRDPMTAAVAWFVLFGVVLFLCGLALYEFEKATQRPLPKSIGWVALGLVALGVTLMPASGFWLALPPVVAILINKVN
jgi:Family of unknown function (DUF6463)